MSGELSIEYVAVENKFDAGNSTLNLIDQTTTSYTIQFAADADQDGVNDDGDLLLEYVDNGDPKSAGPDPDTSIYINGSGPYEVGFIAEGDLPVDGKVPVGDQGTTVVKIVVYDYPNEGDELKLILSPDGSITDWTGYGNGNITLVPSTTDTFVCFQRGTLLQSKDGLVPVEQLKIGDLIETATGILAAVRWVGSRDVSLVELLGNPNARPVCLPIGALGNGVPTTDLWVSPQHRVLVQGHLAETLFGVPEVFVAAKHLDFGDLAKGKRRPSEVEYFHILLDKHDVLIANGAPAESLFLGDQALTMLSDESLAEIEAQFPRDQHPELWSGKVSAPTLNADEAAVLSQALCADLQNAKDGAVAA
ncbi:Hint domain-containing protein [Actibacterium pelagium]|uniref:Hedgehog/Intein (Hint) domain-containing protein n=1 Tax=Actibacterium pelagium TaxID=2029103 RepID=A0A917AFL8_9RHOB|nr:Hint domain-containing protein [Actibacterium pelagium]GGE49577.1 hypothetical protein GCM10011517_16730 [Actibacterium pelagium]